MITVSDPITVNDLKLKAYLNIINLTLKETNLCLASHNGVRYLADITQPVDFGPKKLTDLTFGLLTAKPADIRKRIWGIPIGDPPRSQFVATVEVRFADYESEVTRITISVNGVEYKDQFITLAEVFEKDLEIPSLSVYVKSRYPKEELI